MGGERRGAAARGARGLSPPRPPGSPGGLAPGVGARGQPCDEGGRRGLGPPRRTRGRVDALLGRQPAREGAVTVFLTIDAVTKRFGAVVAADAVSLSIGRGEILALLGPSGSGKTTMLRLLAGFETPDAGRIVVEGEDVTAVPPARRRFGMVFQHYALFPHLDVGANVGFGLRVLTDPGRRAGEALKLVDL